MAKVDADISPLFMNPGAYSQVKDEKKTKDTKRSSKTDFSRVLKEAQGKTAGELGPLENLPVSEETLNGLMDDVHSAGDSLRNRPFPDEIIRYKQAVRNFMHYIVKNCFNLEYEDGIRRLLKPHKRYYKIQVIDSKLEDMAAMLLSRQMPQLELLSRLEEIKGLLVDLLQ